ncbi:hypothetical protein NI343_003340, partial [Salmonella enterica]|nr:hypothetical protein [Salmonella enterica]EJJ4373828.1 hypothetical protein [Salmonella enterica]EKC2480579.1 hypothetical protein [Salmonella enterica]EKC2990608.1 hypothetical protein [Salmonella enterica]
MSIRQEGISGTFTGASGEAGKNKIPAMTTVGYNGRRGDGTLPSQGWTQF